MQPLGSVDFNQPPSVLPSKKKQEIQEETRIETISEDETKRSLHKQKSQGKLDKLLNRTDEKLLRISTVFPFTIFPHQIVIDINKVNVIFRTFFFSQHIHSVVIDDIADVEVSYIP